MPDDYRCPACKQMIDSPGHNLGCKEWEQGVRSVTDWQALRIEELLVENERLRRLQR